VCLSHRGILGDDFLVGGPALPSDEYPGRGRGRGGASEEAGWSEGRLVSLRSEVHNLTLQYRKAKRRFDIAVADAILLHDLAAAYRQLLPLHSMRACLWRAFTAPDDEGSGGVGAGGAGAAEGREGGAGADGGGLWHGIDTPVREPFRGKYWRKKEVARFVWEVVVVRALKVAGAVACGLLSLTFLWSEVAVAPWVRTRFASPQVVANR
jgi:hypothetical protein